MHPLLHFARSDDQSGLFWQIAQRHDRNRYPMQFATLEKIDPALKDAVRARYVPTVDFSAGSKNHTDYLRTIPRLARYLRKNKIEILHTHFYYPSVVGMLAGALARTPCRVITRHHSDYHTRLSAKPNRHVRLDQLCNTLAHKVIAISEHTREHLIEAEGCPAEKVEIVFNGIDFDHVRISDPKRPAELRAQFGGETHDLVLLVARFYHEKGLSHLYRALPEVKKRVKRPFKILHAGTGADMPKYQEEVRQLGCDDVVEFLGFRHDVPDLMAAADLMVLPSIMEAFGLVLAEALYLNLPVLATDVGGIPELIRDGVDGVLVPHSNSEALAEGLITLLNDPERREAMRGSGRERIVGRFGFEQMLEGYERIYGEVLGVRG